MKRIAILGSTGSIGTQAVDVALGLGGRVSVEALSAHSSGEALLEQAARLGVRTVCLTDEEAALHFAGDFADLGIDLLCGMEGLMQLIDDCPCDLVLNAVVGSVGLSPTLRVLERGIALALANKESLVTGGRLVMAASAANSAPVLPVDSEHSAVFQCLRGEGPAGVRRIILTASGGPFRDLGAGELENVTVEEALSHPTWRMGRKVTVDSATLMNKGLEVLEAHHLFGLGLDSIEVVLHPQSIVHSMVEMVDGSVLAQLGVPDMRVPIQYALTYPERAPGPAGFLSLPDRGELTFGEVDDGRFPCLGLAYRAGRSGGTYPAAMNAANEEAVTAFLAGRIRFTDIARVVGAVLDSHSPLPGETLDELTEAEGEARKAAGEIIRSLEGGS